VSICREVPNQAKNDGLPGTVDKYHEGVLVLLGIVSDSRTERFLTTAVVRTMRESETIGQITSAGWSLRCDFAVRECAKAAKLDG
jgi:hypothetical protein